MSKPKLFANSLLVVLSMVLLYSTASAQSNLTAKVNSFQPQPVSVAVESDRVRDGLAGPVRRVRTEVAKISTASSGPTEDKRVVLETASYDIKGGKTENQYFPVTGSALTGKEVYKYDDKGNISEMTLLNGDGSLLSREVYKYDYDSVGNWTKMTTSVAVVESGKVTFEPTEVTYRSIMYYLDENMLKMAQPGAPVVNTPANSNAAKVEVAGPTTQPVSKPAATQTAAANHKVAPSLPPVSNSALRSTTLASAPVPNSGTATDVPKQTVVALDAAPPASSAPKPFLKPVSGGVLNGKAVALPAPSYPETAKRMRTAGMVTVEVVVDENGNVLSAQAVSGPQGLREAARVAASKARFSVTTLSGHPVKVSGVINYNFTLAP
jgi:TonB family protein